MIIIFLCLNMYLCVYLGIRNYGDEKGERRRFNALQISLLLERTPEKAPD